VSIACSQALLPYFLPEQIARYRAEHPGVTFSINIRDRAQAEQDLASVSSDLALVFEPIHLVDFEVLFALPQNVQAVFRDDSPLATKQNLRLRDCVRQKLVLPSRVYGVRHLLEMGAKRKGFTLDADIETESFELIRHYVTHENALGFQIPIGLDPGRQSGITYRQVSEQDVSPGQLLLGQMKGRVLPIASARFANQLMTALAARASG
jgi:DNA-binding transcriptional LysR family regulator